MKNRVEKFKTSWHLTKVYWIVFGLLILIVLVDGGEDMLRELGFILLIAASLTSANWLLGHHLTYLRIINEEVLLFRQEGFIKKQVVVSSIRKIERVRMYHLFKRQGARMKVWYISEGKLRYFRSNEFNFDVPILKDFLNRIKDLNPNIEFASQYEELMQGDWDSKPKDFYYQIAPMES